MAAHQAFQGSLRERSQEITLAGAQDQCQKGSCRGVEGCCEGACPPDGAKAQAEQLPLHLLSCVSRLRYMAGDGWNLKEGARALFVNMVPLILWPHLPQLSEGT